MSLSDIPKVTPTDELILITEEAIKALTQKLSELKALRKPYRGRFEPLVHPRTKRIHNGPKKQQ